MQGIAATRYERESKQAKRERIERARAQESALGATLYERHLSAQATQGLRWKGIVDGTEVRVTERWKRSNAASWLPGTVAPGGRPGKGSRPTADKVTVAAPIRNDYALMAQMGTIHEQDN